jgi:hypothetical protein
VHIFVSIISVNKCHIPNPPISFGPKDIDLCVLRSYPNLDRNLSIVNFCISSISSLVKDIVDRLYLIAGINDPFSAIHPCFRLNELFFMLIPIRSLLFFIFVLCFMLSLIMFLSQPSVVWVSNVSFWWIIISWFNDSSRIVICGQISRCSCMVVGIASPCSLNFQLRMY